MDRCLVEDDFLDYLNHRLALDARERVEAHIDTCASCRTLAADLARLTENDGDSSEKPIAIGDRIGRYVVLEWLGAGGMGTVYKAFDPDLDRNVAVKVLHDGGAATSSLVREAKIAAKIASARVVAAYDVGVDAGRVFLAMELVQGTTLAEWARGEDRLDVRLAMLVEAGEGLAAAHREGIHHGDFKPANVLVGHGHAKITDFGFGRHETDAAKDTPRTGGTPRYMAPEQARSKAPSALADQFSFAVTAWQILTGRHPFFDDDEAGPLLEARPVRTPRGAEPLPKRVRWPLVRAMSFDPLERFPTMDALLEALRPPSRVKTRWAILAASVVVILAGAHRALGPPTVPCAGMEAHLNGIWDAPQKALVHARFLETKVGYASEAWTVMERSVDDYTRRWVDQRSRVCMATRVRREQSEAAFDAKMRCLDDDLRDVRALVALAQRVEPAQMESMASALSQLPRPERCEGATKDGADVPPSSSEAGLRVKSLLAEARALRWNGRHNEAVAPAQRALEEARAIGWTWGEAEALSLIGAGQAWNGKSEAALATLSEALERAEISRNDELRIDVLVLTVQALVIADRALEAASVLPIIRAALRRRNDDPALLARYENAVGVVDDALGKYEAAVEHYRASAKISATRMSEDDIGVLGTRSNIAGALVQQGRPDLAIAEFEDVLARLTKTYGPHPSRTRVMNNLAASYVQVRRFDDALRWTAEGLAILDTTVDKHELSVAVNWSIRGQAFAGLGSTTEAIEAFEKTKQIYARLRGPRHTRVAKTLVHLARVHLQRDEKDAALAAATEAVEIHEMSQKKGGPEHATALGVLANVLLANGNAARAVTLAEEARRMMHSSEPDPIDRAEVDFVLARALSKHHPHDARIDELAADARAAYAARAYLGADLTSIDAWLTTRKAPRRAL